MVTLTLDDALKALYSVDPDEFVTKRKELVDVLLSERGTEDAAMLKRAVKPTVAAWVVNTLALTDHDSVVALVDIGQRMRAAQEDLDADQLRTLSTERYQLVSRVTSKALQLAKRRNPPTSLVDDVRNTFDAAVADVEVARRLGRITRAEQYSGFGFGFGGDGLPQLTLVRGGRTESAAPAAPADSPPKKETAAERRRRQRLVAAKQDAYDQADAEVIGLEQTVAEGERDLKRRTNEIERLRADVENRKHQLDQDRLDLDRWKKHRRQARRELDKAERGTV